MKWHHVEFSILKPPNIIYGSKKSELFKNTIFPGIKTESYLRKKRICYL